MLEVCIRCVQSTSIGSGHPQDSGAALPRCWILTGVMLDGYLDQERSAMCKMQNSRHLAFKLEKEVATKFRCLQLTAEQGVFGSQFWI